MLATAKGTPSISIEPNLDASDLIAVLRAIAKSNLTEMTSYPESLTQAMYAQDLTLPYFVLVAMDSNPVEMAVFDEAEWIPVDLVYVGPIVADGATDTPRAYRKRLEYLAGQVLIEQRAVGSDLWNISRQARVESVAMLRQNAYQTLFSDAGQAVVVEVFRMAFLVVTPTIG